MGNAKEEVGFIDNEFIFTEKGKVGEIMYFQHLKNQHSHCLIMEYHGQIKIVVMDQTEILSRHWIGQPVTSWELPAGAVLKAPIEPYCGPPWAPGSCAGSGCLSLQGQLSEAFLTHSKRSSREAHGVSSVYTRASRLKEKLSAEVSSRVLPGAPPQCAGAYRINNVNVAVC